MIVTTRGIKLSSRYQGRDMLQTIAWYFGIMAIVMIAMMLVSNWLVSRGIGMFREGMRDIVVEGDWDGSTLRLGGIEETSYLLFFILGLNMFRENMWMLLQNGISRRSKFLGHLITVLWGSVAVSIINFLLMTGLKAYGSHLNGRLLETGIGTNGAVGNPLDVSTTVEMLHGLEWNGTTMVIFLLTGFSSLVLAVSIGYFITIMYYRLNTIGKVIVSVGVPVLFLVVLPTLDYRFLNGRITAAAAAFGERFMTARGTPLVSLIVAALFTGAAWLIMRRAPLKRASV